jgi:uncharacterized membrane protein
MTESKPFLFDFISRAALVVLAIQLGVLAHMVFVQGRDDPPTGYLVMVMCTALFANAQRRRGAGNLNAGAAFWVFASRIALLAMLVIGSLVIGFRAMVPSDLAPMITPALFALMWAAIALKGAAAGKFTPGGRMGLCVYWTTHSRLAWDKAHRMLGRVLFWGGLAGLVLNFVVPPLTSLSLWGAVVAGALTLALIESWRAWRMDPDRDGAQTA